MNRSSPQCERQCRAGGAALARRRRRGFTVVELMVSLVLATIIVISATAVFGMVAIAERRLGASFEDASQLSIAQRVLRRSISSLVAAKPEDPTALQAQAKARGEGEGFESSPGNEVASGAGEGEGSSEDELRDLIAGATGDDELAAELTRRRNERAYFELYIDAGSTPATPALEVVVMESPVPSSREVDPSDATAAVTRFLPVRGVFEMLKLEEGLALQWRPTDPAGEPTLLLSGIERVEWWVLPRSRHGREWTDVWAAFLQEDFPVAVRLLIWTNKGTHVDWLFDTAVSTPEAN